jgi:hypothetical protein
LAGEFRDLIDRMTLAGAGGQRIERQDDDAGSSPAMSNGHFTKPPVVGNDDSAGRLRQRENALVAVATTDFLRIHDVKAPPPQPIHDGARDAFVREEGWQGSLCGDDPLMGQIVGRKGLCRADVVGGEMRIIC